MPGPKPRRGLAGPVAEYLEDLTGVSPGDDPVVLPPLVTVIAKKPTAA